MSSAHFKQYIHIKVFNTGNVNVGTRKNEMTKEPEHNKNLVFL